MNVEQFQERVLLTLENIKEDMAEIKKNVERHAEAIAQQPVACAENRAALRKELGDGKAKTITVTATVTIAAISAAAAVVAWLR